ncbi:hypothetical protein HMPREF3213_03844, partial [Heyndrickxia coagulans]
MPKLSASLPNLEILVILASPMLRKRGKMKAFLHIRASTVRKQAKLTAFLNLELAYVKKAGKNED